MIAASLLWIPFTLLAAAGQTARNAMQRELTAVLGTVGATGALCRRKGEAGFGELGRSRGWWWLYWWFFISRCSRH